MHLPLISVLSLALALASAEVVSVTPHEQYSSSIGVPGCLINTDRVAYFPSLPSCTEPCVRITHPESGRQCTLLHIDTSGGAHDISYDAWNYLGWGVGARDDPKTGGGINMEIKRVAFEDDECQALLGRTDGKIPNMAISPNWALSCPSMDYVVLYNFETQNCKAGAKEICHMEGQVPQCPSGLAMGEGYTGPYVTNVEYGTGRDVEAP